MKLPVRALPVAPNIAGEDTARHEKHDGEEGEEAEMADGISMCDHSAISEETLEGKSARVRDFVTHARLLGEPPVGPFESAGPQPSRSPVCRQAQIPGGALATCWLAIVDAFRTRVGGAEKR